jgi:hypothetical protein
MNCKPVVQWLWRCEWGKHVKIMVERSVVVVVVCGRGWNVSL